MTFFERSAMLWNKAAYLSFLTARYGAFRRGRGFRGESGDYFERYLFYYKREQFYIVITGDEPNFSEFDYSAFSRFFPEGQFVLGADRDTVIQFLGDVLQLASFSIVGDDGAERYVLSLGFFVKNIGPQIDTETLKFIAAAWEHDFLLTLSVLRDPRIALGETITNSFAKTIKAMQPIGTGVLAEKLAPASHLNSLISAQMGKSVFCDFCGGSGRRFLRLSACSSCNGSGIISIVD